MATADAGHETRVRLADDAGAQPSRSLVVVLVVEAVGQRVRPLRR